MMKPFTKGFWKVFAVLPLLWGAGPAHGADSLITIGAGASITGGTGTDVCADAHAFTGTFDGNWCTVPLLVELLSFEAQGFADYVRLMWETASEKDCVGFHLYRRSGEGEYARITPVLIPSEGSPAWGSAYSFDDVDVAPGMTYAYKLADVNAAGFSTSHGGAVAWAGRVNIQANAADGPATVPAAEPVSITVSVRPEEGMTDPQEWWLCCESPFGWFSYVNPKGWVPGIQPAWVNPQVPIDNLEVLNDPLPPGDYAFHFALDSRVDGRAPAPLFTPQAQPLEKLLLKGPSSASHGLQQLDRWQTAGPDWIDSVEITVE